MGSNRALACWEPKLLNNKRRDKEKTLMLENAGWTVLRFWEHEIKDKAYVDLVIAKIAEHIMAKKQNNF